MTGGNLHQLLYQVSNGNRAIFADILGVPVSQIERWIWAEDREAEIPGSEWLDEFAETWKRDEKEARLQARHEGREIEFNTLGMPEYEQAMLEYFRRKYQNDLENLKN